MMGGGRRAAQSTDLPTTHAVGQCEEPCNYEQPWACKTTATCTQNGGRWQDGDDTDGDGQPDRPGAAPSPARNPR